MDSSEEIGQMSSRQILVEAQDLVAVAKRRGWMQSPDENEAKAAVAEVERLRKQVRKAYLTRKKREQRAAEKAAEQGLE